MNRYIKPYHLFDDFNRLLNSLDPASDSATVETSQWRPAVDIKETPSAFFVTADIPGVKSSDIDVTMEHNVLTIKGERRTEKTDSNESFTRTERSLGTFYRQFTLPETADEANIKAKSQQGVLEIMIPKLERAQKRKIEISVAEQ